MANGNVQDFFERVADSKMADGIGWRVAPGFTVYSSIELEIIPIQNKYGSFININISILNN